MHKSKNRCFIECCNMISLIFLAFSHLQMSVVGLLVGFMVFNATFNNISVISWQLILLVKENGRSGENHGLDRMVVRFTTNYAISAYHH